MNQDTGPRTCLQLMNLLLGHLAFHPSFTLHYLILINILTQINFSLTLILQNNDVSLLSSRILSGTCPASQWKEHPSPEQQRIRLPLQVQPRLQEVRLGMMHWRILMMMMKVRSSGHSLQRRHLVSPAPPTDLHQ